jgi:hypothetical protein
MYRRAMCFTPRTYDLQREGLHVSLLTEEDHSSKEEDAPATFEHGL